MASVLDVAEFVLREAGPLPAIKLQKLVYYSHAWSLVWDSRPLFPEEIQAWVNGPVVPVLYDAHRGQYQVSPGFSNGTGDPARLDGAARDTVGIVVEYYGKHDSQWLSDLTHSERPWLEARQGLGPSERGTKRITDDVMAEYYSSLATSG